MRIFFKMSIFCNIYLVDKINNWYCRKFSEKFQLTTPYWSMISSLLHLVGLRPRVYYTLTNFRGGGAIRPPWPPSIRQCMGPPRMNFFAYYIGGPPQINLFAYYRGPPSINFFAKLLYGGPLG